MRRGTRSGVAAVIALLVQAAAGNAQTTSPQELLKETAAPGERIPYGKGTLQFGDLRVPDGPGSHPVAILVHGGCWSAKLGQLPEAATSLDLLRPLAAALVQNGIAQPGATARRNTYGIARAVSPGLSNRVVANRDETGIADWGQTQRRVDRDNKILCSDSEKCWRSGNRHDVAKRWSFRRFESEGAGVGDSPCQHSIDRRDEVDGKMIRGPCSRREAPVATL